jgi:hypothetical protein
MQVAFLYQHSQSSASPGFSAGAGQVTGLLRSVF